jgi:hypothetical protein
MDRFTAAPYNLTQGDLIVVVVRAMNVIGWSSLSTPNVVGIVA